MKRTKTYDTIGSTISVSGGLQSSTLFQMACLGLIKPRPLFGIFADTRWERDSTMQQMEYLREFGKQMEIPIITVYHGNIRNAMLDAALSDTPGMPFYIRNSKGKIVPLRRQCTKDYKIIPIQEKVRELTGCTYKKPMEQWIGFSVDEVVRVKPSRVKFMVNRFPLIEMRMGRDSCVEWLKKNGFPIPSKSACIGCPCHSNNTWNLLSKNELEDAIKFDEQIRNRPLASRKGKSNREKKNRMNPNQPDLFRVNHSHAPADLVVSDDRQYLHASGEPLSTKPFQRIADEQQEFELGYDPETEECEGGCFL